eukprot:CAMPEP_0119049850 /NCGR_PEP_ID=MMETSP1177-20130426/66758_1 /TAXON_ID=2985 /ORGANISM="Ochromonas sp, Strain CCMP1899" /LENGTH=152 /DNA_ID=CAMNT_0007027567 /DNA_START=117 /DNA_END=572 /DNA_ORIENTATION=+
MKLSVIISQCMKTFFDKKYKDIGLVRSRMSVSTRSLSTSDAGSSSADSYLSSANDSISTDEHNDRRIHNDPDAIDDTTNPEIHEALKKKHFSNNDIPLLTIAAKALSRDSLKINSDSSDDSDTGVIPGFQEVIQANKNLIIEDTVETKTRSE